MDKYITMLQNVELPTENEIKSICEKAKEILIKEDNVVHLSLPISICGDLHGQFYDLLELFEVGDYCPETNYCFMGDYVDRGMHSIETFLYLLLIKIKYPSYITLLRGNHECRETTKVYGFYSECKHKFEGNNVYKYFMDVFDLLPISAVIDQNIFVVHGGLSPKLNNISDITVYFLKKVINFY